MVELKLTGSKKHNRADQINVECLLAQTCVRWPIKAWRGRALKRQEHKQSVSRPIHKVGNSFVLPLIHQVQSMSVWMEKPAGWDRVCRSDGVHSLTSKQIVHSSNTKEMSHTSTHKATVQDQTSQSVFRVVYQDKNTTFTCGKVSVILSVLLTVPPISAGKTSPVPGSESQAAPPVEWWWLCDVI